MIGAQETLLIIIVKHFCGFCFSGQKVCIYIFYLKYKSSVTLKIYLL